MYSYRKVVTSKKCLWFSINTVFFELLFEDTVVKTFRNYALSDIQNLTHLLNVARTLGYSTGYIRGSQQRRNP
jgi:hypothetical protein